MKKNVLQLLTLIFVTAILCSAQTPINEWQGIKPLHSTRNDVEKLFGKPMKGETHLYDTPEVRVSVYYNKGTCKENKSNSFDVPRGTVFSFLVSFKTSFNVREIIDKSSQPFEKVADPKMEGQFQYFSQDGSVRIATEISSDNNIEGVRYIIYSPTKADDYLRCSSLKH
jgi:hypothetical protein